MEKIKISIFIGIFFFLALSLVALKEISLSNSQRDIKTTNLSDTYDTENLYGYFHGKKFSSLPKLAYKQSAQKVLGESATDKRIEVDLTNQKLYAFEDGEEVYNFLVSTGKWGWTPTGEFSIWSKFRYSLMTGGSQALGTYYYLPNVPFVMFFYNADVPKSKGFSIHGTYWHSNFGHPMSHGCINMKTEEAEKIFAWADLDTKIVIYGDTPNE